MNKLHDKGTYLCENERTTQKVKCLLDVKLARSLEGKFDDCVISPLNSVQCSMIACPRVGHIDTHKHKSPT
jgi:hypothetical protein